MDIVFLHGLTGKAYRTWHHKDADVHWPSELLGLDVPDSRILNYSYDADVVGMSIWSPPSSNRLQHHSENLLGQLVRLRERTKSEDRTILFVAHSLGGLLVQSALAASKSAIEGHLHQLERCTRGIGKFERPSKFSPTFEVVYL